MPEFRAIRRQAGWSAWRWAVPERTDAVILELGANDALRGLDPAQAKANLDKIITALKASGAEVLLAGMFAPRNLGEDYVRAFDGIYPELASKHGLILYPFFLDGVALDAKLNLDDGMHPNRRGVAEITKRILPSVEQLIERGARQAAAAAPKAKPCRACSRRSRYREPVRTAPVAHPGAARRRELDRAREHAHHPALRRRHRRAHGRRVRELPRRRPRQAVPGHDRGRRRLRRPRPARAVGRRGGGRARSMRSTAANERAARAAGLEPEAAPSSRT